MKRPSKWWDPFSCSIIMFLLVYIYIYSIPCVCIEERKPCYIMALSKSHPHRNMKPFGRLSFDCIYVSIIPSLVVVVVGVKSSESLSYIIRCCAYIIHSTKHNTEKKKFNIGLFRARQHPWCQHPLRFHGTPVGRSLDYIRHQLYNKQSTLDNGARGLY